jgi:hypothetical protein
MTLASAVRHLLPYFLVLSACAEKPRPITVPPEPVPTYAWSRGRNSRAPAGCWRQLPDELARKAGLPEKPELLVARDDGTLWRINAWGRPVRQLSTSAGLTFQEHAGRIWILRDVGEDLALVSVDAKSGTEQPVARWPGFVQCGSKRLWVAERAVLRLSFTADGEVCIADRDFLEADVRWQARVDVAGGKLAFVGKQCPGEPYPFIQERWVCPASDDGQWRERVGAEHWEDAPTIAAAPEDPAAKCRVVRPKPWREEEEDSYNVGFLQLPPVVQCRSATGQWEETGENAFEFAPSDTVRWREWQLLRGGLGRPFLKDPSMSFMNLHTGDRFVVAPGPLHPAAAPTAPLPIAPREYGWHAPLMLFPDLDFVYVVGAGGYCPGRFE